MTILDIYPCVSVSPTLSLLFSSCRAHPPDPHSFPTRRSSDLDQAEVAVGPPRRLAGVELLPAEMEDRVGILARDFPIGDDMRVRSEETRLNSSHVKISYAVFCLKKKRIKHAHLSRDLQSGAIM